jgi:hypothetical protein
MKDNIMIHKISQCVLSYLLVSYPVYAEILDMDEYIKSMDLAEVAFAGRIKYSKRDNEFTFYNAKRDYFSVTIDAGRKTRERIENECENAGFMVSWKDLCVISGNGTIEIRGSSIHLSIDEMLVLEKP